MTQPPYRLPEDHPMRRFAIFVAVLIVIVAIGSQPSHVTRSNKSMCVRIPSRAVFILKSAIAKTWARSAHTFTVTTAVAQ